jgi:ribonuclease P protein component
MDFAQRCEPAQVARPSADVAFGVVSELPRRISTLRGRTDFDRLYSTGRRRRIGGLIVISAPALSDPGRVAFVASRKVGGAVARNRAKRRMREAFASVVPNAAADVVYTASPSVLSAPFDQLVVWMKDANRV